MNMKRKPPTVRQNNAKKPQLCDQKTAANALLLLSNSRNDVGKANDEILAAETCPLWMLHPRIENQL